jgi:hypothetical protein
VQLLDDPEALGLLALMLLHEARRARASMPRATSSSWKTKTGQSGISSDGLA